MVCPQCTLTRAQTGLHVRVGGRPVVLRLEHGAWLDPKTKKYPQDFKEPEGEDPRFGVRLWLQSQCCGGHLLWANNLAHLDYLQAYVGATLRERPKGHARLSWYLPAWMKQAKHREAVLQTLVHLRATLPD